MRQSASSDGGLTGDANPPEAQTKRAADAFWLLLCGLFLIALGTRGIFWIVVDWWPGLANQSWTITYGTILDSNLEQNRSRTKNSIKIVYAYTVEGKESVGTRLSFPESSGDDEETCRRKLNRQYARNSRCPVYYNPSNPRAACLEPGTNLFGLILITVLVVLLFGSSIALLTLAVRLFRSPERADTEDLLPGFSGQIESLPLHQSRNAPGITPVSEQGSSSSSPSLPAVSELDLIRLGSLQATFRTGSGLHKLEYILGFVLTLCFGTLAAYVFLREHPGDGEWGRFLVGLLCSCPTLFLGAGTVVSFRRLSWRIFLFENGFVSQHRSRAETIFWRDIRHHYEVILEGVPNDHSLRLETDSGRAFNLNGTFRNIATLASGIRAGVTPALLAKAEERLAEEQSVSFGALQLGNDGLANGKEKIRWQDVTRVEVKPTNGVHELVIRQVGEGTPWFSKPVPEVPNFEVFMVLSKRLLDSRRKLR